MNQSPSLPFVRLLRAIVCSDYVTPAHTVQHKPNEAPATCHPIKTKVDRLVDETAGNHDQKTGDAGKKRMFCFCVLEFGRLVAFTLRQ